MLRALVLAAAALPFGWNHPPAAPLRIPGGVAGIALDGNTLVVAGRTKLLIAPLDTGRNYSRRACASGFVHDGRTAVAASGGRLAWLCRGPAGPDHVQLWTTSLVPRDAAPALVDHADASSHPLGLVRPWITHLIGGGGQIAYAHGDPVSHPQLLGATPLPITGADGYFPLAISSTSTALSNTVNLVVRTGDASAAVGLAGPPGAAAFDGQRLAVLIPDNVELHDLTTGSSLTVNVPGARLLDAGHGLVVVATQRDVFAIDERTGAAWLVVSTSAPLTAVAISRYGLAFVSQRGAAQKVGFVSAIPLKTVYAARRRAAGA
jgi:hypothetical protein